jgi:hypothetical protein
MLLRRKPIERPNLPEKPEVYEHKFNRSTEHYLSIVHNTYRLPQVRMKVIAEFIHKIGRSKNFKALIRIKPKFIIDYAKQLSIKIDFMTMEEVIDVLLSENPEFKSDMLKEAKASRNTLKKIYEELSKDELISYYTELGNLYRYSGRHNIATNYYLKASGILIDVGKVKDAISLLREVGNYIDVGLIYEKKLSENFNAVINYDLSRNKGFWTYVLDFYVEYADKNVYLLKKSYQNLFMKEL